jgi:hypothetical protein
LNVVVLAGAQSKRSARCTSAVQHSRIISAPAPAGEAGLAASLSSRGSVELASARYVPLSFAMNHPLKRRGWSLPPTPQQRTTVLLRRYRGRTPVTISILNRSSKAMPHRRRSRTCTHASTLTVSQLSGSPSAPPKTGWSRWLLVLAGMLFTTVVGLVRPPATSRNPYRLRRLHPPTAPAASRWPTGLELMPLR